MSRVHFVIYQLACQLLFSLAAMASDCPPQLGGACRCEDFFGDDEYHCELNGAKFTLTASVASEARIECADDSGPLSGAVLPPFPVSNFVTLQKLSVSNCPLAGAAAAVVRALGAPGAALVTLQGTRGEVTAEHLRGLVGVRTLELDDNESQTTLPLEAFADLPLLTSVRVHKAALQLTPGARPVNRRLRNLELSAAGVRSVPAGAFSSLEALEQLLLVNSGLETLEKGAFQGLGELRSLALNRNPLRELLPGVLSDTPKLRTLELTASGLERFAGDALKDLLLLEKVTIQRGHSKLTLEPKSLSDLPSLREVSITSTPLDPLPEDLLQLSGQLQTLNISYCGLEELPELLFQDLVNLTTLDLSGNQLRSLHPHQFQPAYMLRTISLVDNQLETLPDYIFAGLTNLLTLKLDGNHLTIAEKTFNPLKSLRVLTLSRNNLTLHDAERSRGKPKVLFPFKNLLNLEELDLSQNQINTIFINWRYWLQIKLINLSGNKIEMLEAKDIEFQADVVVDLRQNEITGIKVDPHLDAFPGATYLLDDNPINCDCTLVPFLNFTLHHQHPRFQIGHTVCRAPEQFRNKTLKDISLNLPSLTCNIEKACPKHCTCVSRPASSSLEMDCLITPSVNDYPKPKLFNLTKSKLRLRNTQTSYTLPTSVYSLNLSNLGLTEVPLVPKSIKELDLRANPIRIIPEWLLRGDINLYLPNNSLTCDCNTKDSIKHINKYIVRNFDDLLCEDGVSLAKIDIRSLCTIYDVTIVSVALAALGSLLVVIITTVFVYRYIVAIKKLMYDLGWSLFIIEEEVDGKSYDVLVSYPDECTKYVAQQFVPTLEDAGYSVCVRYRDWDIGDWIPEKVNLLVEKSRRTVVLISNEYFNSMSYLELKVALLNEKRGKWTRVLPVLMKVSEPNENVNAIKASRRCLDLEDRLFWRRLRRKLPKKREPRPLGDKLGQKTLNVLLAEGGGIHSSKIQLDR